MAWHPPRIGTRVTPHSTFGARERIPGEKGGADGRKEQSSLAMSEMGHSLPNGSPSPMSGIGLKEEVDAHALLGFDPSSILARNLEFESEEDAAERVWRAMLEIRRSPNET